MSKLVIGGVFEAIFEDLEESLDVLLRVGRSGGFLFFPLFDAMVEGVNEFVVGLHLGTGRANLEREAAIIGHYNDLLGIRSVFDPFNDIFVGALSFGCVGDDEGTGIGQAALFIPFMRSIKNEGPREV